MNKLLKTYFILSQDAQKDNPFYKVFWMIFP